MFSIYLHVSVYPFIIHFIPSRCATDAEFIYLVRRPLPERERASLHGHLPIPCNTQAQQTPDHSNPLQSPILQTTNQLYCESARSLLSIILKGQDFRTTGCHRGPHGPTSCSNLLAPMASNPHEIRGDLYKSMRIQVLASMGKVQDSPHPPKPSHPLKSMRINGNQK